MRRRHPSEGVLDTTVADSYSFPDDDGEDVEEVVPPHEEPVHGQQILIFPGANFDCFRNN